MNTDHPDKSEVKVSASRHQNGFLKNIVLNIRGPGPFVIIVSWLIVVCLICIFAKADGLRYGVMLLLAFLAFYMLLLGVAGPHQPPAKEYRIDDENADTTNAG